MSPSLRKTEKTAIGRHPERGSYDRALAYSILDEGLVAHVGLDTDEGVIVIPMAYARLGDEIVLHGAAASRWLSGFAEGKDISVCVTLLDGLVLARSAFAHSMNYRSVVAFGPALPIEDKGQKEKAFKAFLDHLLPGRWQDCRQPDRKEVAATIVLSMPLDEASVKVRSGPPMDSAKDSDLNYWAGIIPLSLQAGQPVPDPLLPERCTPPDYLAGYSR